jgi:hypothetical protein
VLLLLQNIQRKWLSSENCGDFIKIPQDAGPWGGHCDSSKPGTFQRDDYEYQTVPYHPYLQIPYLQEQTHSN